MSEMHGVDVSHWQGNIRFGSFNKDFLIAKCTESTNYRDPKYKRNQRNAYKRNIFFGAYHFARGHNPRAEADYFIDHANLHATDIPVLDWEIDHADEDGWCAEFCQRVKDRVGVPPLVYMNKARKNRSSWRKTRATGAGLWFARYQHDIDTSQPWPVVAMFQWTARGDAAGISGNVDLDTFYGDGVTWAAYGLSDGKAEPRKPKHSKPRKHKDKTKTHNSGPNHRPGDVGSGVRGIQRVVGAEIDGRYGDETKAKVADWQADHGLKPDGIWGPKTRAEYARTRQPHKSNGGVLKIGSTGSEVSELQRVLNEWYPSRRPLAVDGKYGRKTRARVRYFQKRAGIVVDGKAGDVTLGKLGIR